MSIFAPTPEIIAYLNEHFRSGLAPPSCSTTTTHPPARRPLTTTIYDHSLHAHLLPAFASLHASVIELDHTISTFTVPLTPQKRERMLKFWEARAAEAGRGECTIIMVLTPREVGTETQAAAVGSGSGGSTEGIAGGSREEELAGYVVLAKNSSETAARSADIQKLAVSPRHRRKGVARVLMRKVEEIALADEQTLLLVNTEIGTAAVHLFETLGYTKIGILPNHRISPADGTLRATVYFYKDLSTGGTGGAAASA